MKYGRLVAKNLWKFTRIQIRLIFIALLIYSDLYLLGVSDIVFSFLVAALICLFASYFYGLHWKLVLSIC